MSNHQRIDDKATLTKLVAEWRGSGGLIQRAPRELLVQLCTARYPRVSREGWDEPKLVDLVAVHGFRDVSEVTRLLKRAIKEGVVEFHIKQDGRLPGEQLQEHFPHLKKVIEVRGSSSFEGLLKGYGDAMRQMLKDFSVEKGGAMTVALGGGRPIRAMVDAMEEQDRQIEFVPTNLIARQNVRDAFDSSYLCLMAHLKSRAKSSAHLRGVPLYDGAGSKDAALKYYHTLNSMIGYSTSAVLQDCLTKLDVIFEGVSHLDPNGFTFHDFYSSCGIKVAHAKEAGGIGHINYSIFDKDGADVTAQMCKASMPKNEGMESGFFHPFLPAISARGYKELVEKRKCQVVIAAGEFHDRRVIFAALKGGICNHLITDEATAKALAEECKRERELVP